MANTIMVELNQVTEAHGGKAQGLRRLIEGGFQVPPGLAVSAEAVEALLAGNEQLTAVLGAWLTQHGRPVAVRSSAANEDGTTASFAGMYDTRLGISPQLADVLPAIEAVSGSSSSARVSAYADAQTARIPVIIQQMIDPSVSGVAFTAAVASDGADSLYVEWVEGLGEQLVSGRATPARLTVPWDSASRRLRRDRLTLTGNTLPKQNVASLCDAVERVASTYDGSWDIEWSIDRDGALWLLQLRPITRPILVTEPCTMALAIPASPGRAQGPAFLVDDEGDTTGLHDGDVLVAEITEVDYVPAMRRAAAIVTEQGGMLSHAAIIAREFGKPCIVGLTGAREQLQPQAVTTVDGTTGLIQQNGLILGAGHRQEMDWRSLCFYDRGIEVEAAGTSVYVEALPTGVTAYTADVLDASQLARVQAELRRGFHREVEIVTDQKLLWYWEWQRFNQMHPIAFLEAMLRVAIARWNASDLGRAITAIMDLARASAGHAHDTRLAKLYASEFGAALHALCGVAVEGIGAWAAYRDTLGWRQATGLTFSDMLTVPDTDSRLTPGIQHIRACLHTLSKLRNESYPYFISTGAFTLEYFQGKRAELVERVCNEQALPYENEHESLNHLYTLQGFRQHDEQWFTRTLALVE